MIIDSLSGKEIRLPSSLFSTEFLLDESGNKVTSATVDSKAFFFKKRSYIPSTSSDSPDYDNIEDSLQALERYMDRSTSMIRAQLLVLSRELKEKRGKYERFNSILGSSPLFENQKSDRKKMCDVLKRANSNIARYGNDMKNILLKFEKEENSYRNLNEKDDRERVLKLVNIKFNLGRFTTDAERIRSNIKRTEEGLNIPKATLALLSEFLRRETVLHLVYRKLREVEHTLNHENNLRESFKSSEIWRLGDNPMNQVQNLFLNDRVSSIDISKFIDPRFFKYFDKLSSKSENDGNELNFEDLLQRRIKMNRNEENERSTYESKYRSRRRRRRRNVGVTKDEDMYEKLGRKEKESMEHRFNTDIEQIRLQEQMALMAIQHGELENLKHLERKKKKFKDITEAPDGVETFKSKRLAKRRSDIEEPEESVEGMMMLAPVVKPNSGLYYPEHNSDSNGSRGEEPPPFLE